MTELIRLTAYASINRIMLSTSTVSNDSIIRGGFCPVDPEGFGAAYRFEEGLFRGSLSSYDAEEGRRMKEALEEIFGDLTMLRDFMGAEK